MVLLGFYFMHVVASLSAAVRAFSAHLYGRIHFSEPDENGDITHNLA